MRSWKIFDYLTPYLYHGMYIIVALEYNKVSLLRKGIPGGWILTHSIFRMAGICKVIIEHP